MWGSEQPTAQASCIHHGTERGQSGANPGLGGGQRREAQGSPAPADTHQLSEGASLPSSAESLRRSRLLQTCQEGSTGRGCWHRIGRGLGLGLPPSGSLGSQCHSDIMDESQVWLSNIGAAPPSSAWPAGPSQNGISFVSCLL